MSRRVLHLQQLVGYHGHNSVLCSAGLYEMQLWLCVSNLETGVCHVIGRTDTLMSPWLAG